MEFINVVKPKPQVIKKELKPKVFFLRISVNRGTCTLSPEFLPPVAGICDSLDFFFDKETKVFRFRLGVGCATKLKDGKSFYIPSKIARAINEKHDIYPYAYPARYGGYNRSFYYELKMEPDGYWYGNYIGRENPNK